MTAALAPAPLDLWADAATRGDPRATFTARHQRGLIRLPYTFGDEPGKRAGDLAPAWVCCDPACSGVELTADGLDLNHRCCERWPCCAEHPATRQGRHMAGYGLRWFAGYYHGPFTEHWEASR